MPCRLLCSYANAIRFMFVSIVKESDGPLGVTLTGRTFSAISCPGVALYCNATEPSPCTAASTTGELSRIPGHQWFNQYGEQRSNTKSQFHFYKCDYLSLYIPSIDPYNRIFPFKIFTKVSCGNLS
jgi:hypothetical protein